MKGVILVHVMHRSGEVEHHWVNSNHMKDTLVHLVFGTHELTKLAVEQHAVVIPKIMKDCQADEDMSWLTPSVVCSMCAITKRLENEKSNLSS